MKTSILISFIIFSVPTVLWGQLDTLVVSKSSYIDYVSVQETLLSDKTHKLTIDFDNFPPYSVHTKIPDKKEKKLFNNILSLLEKRLHEVKVLYIENPTVLGQQDTSSEKIMYDTTLCSIYKLNFKKMTALETVYLIGNDADDIIEMPYGFYSTPVKTIYCYNLRYPDRLTSAVHKRRKDINVFSDKLHDLTDKDKVLKVLGP